MFNEMKVVFSDSAFLSIIVKKSTEIWKMKPFIDAWNVLFITSEIKSAIL